MSKELMPAPEEGSSAKSLKFRTVGDSAVLAVTGYSEVPATTMRGEPKLTSRGDRAIDVVVSGLLVSTEGKNGGVKILDDGEIKNDEDATPGEEYSVWFTGPRWWQWLQAVKVQKSPLKVGDFMVVKFASQEKPSNPSHSPKAVWDISFATPSKPEFVKWQDKAIAIEKERSAVELVSSAVSGDSDADPEDDPF